jgi:hypothetical protein
MEINESNSAEKIRISKLEFSYVRQGKIKGPEGSKSLTLPDFKTIGT